MGRGCDWVKRSPYLICHMPEHLWALRYGPTLNVCFCCVNEGHLRNLKKKEIYDDSENESWKFEFEFIWGSLTFLHIFTASCHVWASEELVGENNSSWFLPSSFFKSIWIVSILLFLDIIIGYNSMQDCNCALFRFINDLYSSLISYSLCITTRCRECMYINVVVSYKYSPTWYKREKFLKIAPQELFLRHLTMKKL